MKILIQNGRVIDPASGLDQTADVAIAAGHIVAMGQAPQDFKPNKVIDAQGCIVAPGLVDARRCISYLTIEHDGPIDLALRPLMGNHIYGCDDCQLICPWNKFAQASSLPDFDVRAGLVGQDMARLLAWTEDEFLRYTEGSPIRRIGHTRWLRNLAVAAGNALSHADDVRLRQALQAHLTHSNAVVREHVQWALAHKAP